MLPGFVKSVIRGILGSAKRCRFTVRSCEAARQGSGAEIDSQRRDYVFVGLSNFPATDATLGRVGGAVLAGSTDVAASEQAYIGTFTFRVSQDAIGAFNVRALSEYVALFSEFEAPVINPIEDTIVLVTGATRGR